MKLVIKNIIIQYFKNILPYLVIFLITLYPPSDPDLGWHLKYGEYFFSHNRILMENPFSSEMQDYLWVNSSWGTDLITYSIFHTFGFLGLSIAGAVVITATCFLFFSGANFTFFQKTVFIPIILYFEEPLSRVSFRGHLLTLLAIGILFYILSQFERGKKQIIFFLPLLFMLWTNIHGEFVLGLGLLFLWIVLHLIRSLLQRSFVIIRDMKMLLFTFFFSIGFTSIHPWGVKIYLETIRHFGNPYQQYIVEWLPFDKYTFFWWSIVLWGIVLAISIFLLWRDKKHISKMPWVGIACILFLLTFWMRRYAWPMFYLSLPIVIQTISFLTPKKERLASIIGSFILILYYFQTVLILNPKKSVQTMSWNRYCKEFLLCSPQSAQFLSEYKFQEPMLTFYNWGGWLIWNYSSIKPSIDGRMHLWRDEKGYSAFWRYYAYEQGWSNIDTSTYNTVYMIRSKPLYQQLEKLVSEHRWEKVYQDDSTAIFIRTKILTDKI